MPSESSMNTPIKQAAQAVKTPAGAQTDTPKTEYPRGFGWEKPNQKWSADWLILFLLMIPIDLAGYYFTRDWGIFKWLPYMFLFYGTLASFVHIFSPVIDYGPTVYEGRNKSGVLWSTVPPAIRNSPAGRFYDPFEDE